MALGRPTKYLKHNLYSKILFVHLNPHLTDYSSQNKTEVNCLWYIIRNTELHPYFSKKKNKTKLGYLLEALTSLRKLAMLKWRE